MTIPNPDIETRIRVQTIGASSEDKKYRVTLLVMWHFLHLLDVSRDCAINVFSISGLGTIQNLNLFKNFAHDLMKNKVKLFCVILKAIEMTSNVMCIYQPEMNRRAH